MKTGNALRPRARNRTFSGRVESLEARTLLNATIDVDAAGRLTYRTDLGAPSAVRVSEVAGVYTFAVGATDAPIDVTGNAAGLVVTGNGTRSVAVAGPSALEVDAVADSDSILLASAGVPATIAAWADDVLVTVGDAADPRGLGALPAPVAVGGSPTSSNVRLVLDDSGWQANNPWPNPVPYTYFRLTNDSVTSRDGVGVLSYSGVSALTLRGAPSFGPSSYAFVLVWSTADGVDTRIDLTAGNALFQNVTVYGTSADPSSRLTILGGKTGMDTSIESSSSPVTYQPSPGSSEDSFRVVASGMTAGSLITLDGGGGYSSLRIDANQLPITSANFQVDAGALVFSPPPPQGGTVRFSNVASVYVLGLTQATTVVESKSLDAVAGQALANVVVATITTTLQNATTADFYPTIIWNDGTRADGGTVVADPGDPTRFYVLGTHTFAQSGTFTPGVMVRSQGRTATSTVGGVPISFSSSGDEDFSANALAIEGGLQRGRPDGDTIINDPKPFMAGQITAAEGAARIVAYATPDGGAPFVIGQSLSEGFGSWQIQPDVPLPDGRYTIQVQAFDDAKHLASAPTTLQTGLVIDTVGPRIVGVQFLPGQGRVVVSYRDYGGVDNAGTGVVAPADTYGFSQLENPARGYHPPAQWTISRVADLHTRRKAPQRVSVQINRGRPIRGGSYLFTVQTTVGIHDGAGNLLQGDTAFRLSALHRRINRAQAVEAPPFTPPGPPGRPPLRPPVEP